MSHITEIETEVRDAAVVDTACRRLGLPQPKRGTFKLYSGNVAGLGVQLPGWRYPAVCNTETGKLKYDNFNGHWGEQVHVDRFLQAYLVEKSKLEARKKGHQVQEHSLPGGFIKVEVQVGGQA